MTSAPSTAAGPRPTPQHRRQRADGRDRLPAVTGILAVLGGAAWVAAAVVHASQPTGCVGDACSVTSMREATTSTTVLIAVAAVLMLASGAGLLAVVRRAGRLGRTGTTGAVLCAAGVATLTLAVALQELVAGGDWTWMPWFVGPGVLLLAAGAVLVGWTVVRSPAVPRWVGAGLIVGASLLVLSNEQTAAVLLVVPFGVAWATMGVVLVLRSRTGGISRIDVR